MRQWFGDGSPAGATATANLALVEQRAHKLDAAAKHYESAVQVLRLFPELGLTLKTVLQHYAELLKDMHREQQAKALNTEIKGFRFN
jgi:hypothetical protein